MPGPHPEGYCPVFGNYPKEYNRKVHGPYYPWVNYAPTGDKQFKDVKLGELRGWFARRNKTPQAIIAAFSREMWTWTNTWMAPRYASPAKAFLQVAFFGSLISMFGCYGLLKSHRSHKYHW